MDDETWFLNSSKGLVEDDVYAARSWLLAAKTIFPHSLNLQLEEYNLELERNNAQECSKILTEIFRDFSSEATLWKVIEKLIQAVQNNSNSIHQIIFNGLPVTTQQRMIIGCAENETDISKYCQIMLLLMNKFSDKVAQYGIALIEKLVDREKRETDPLQIKKCRRILVCEVLPVICGSGNINVSHRHFYKWIQKSTEFYALHFTNQTDKNVLGCWDEMEKLRSLIAKQCNWNTDETSTSSSGLVERMAFMKELFQKSKTDVDGAINRKQIFYTTIILLFESCSKYMYGIAPSIYRDQEKNEDSYMNVVNWNEELDYSTAIKSSDEIRETFHVAREAWNVLHNNESFEKDFKHLIRRWKCEKWFWFQLCLVDLYNYEANYKSALYQLQQIESKLNDPKIRKEIVTRVHCLLASTCFNLNMYTDCCHYVFQSLQHFQVTKSPIIHHVTRIQPITIKRKCYFNLHNISSTVSQVNLYSLKLCIEELLPMWVHYLITSLQRAAPTDQTLGHIMVLCQYEWPRWKSNFQSVLQKITQNKKFTFPPFFNFVINVDMVEEMAYLKNYNLCQLSLKQTSHIRAHVTRGVNREADDDFWNAMKHNIGRSGEHVDKIIFEYLSSARENITACIKEGEVMEID